MDAQTILAVLVGVALACFSLVMVGYSFFRNRNPQQEATATTSVPDGDGVGLDSLFDSLETLELEHQLGNIPDEQYAQQQLAYRQQIAALIREQMESGEAPPELLLEQEVLRARADGVTVWRPCPQCDAPLPMPSANDSGDPTCPHCNANMSGMALGDGHSEAFTQTPVQPIEQ